MATSPVLFATDCPPIAIASDPNACAPAVPLPPMAVEPTPEALTGVATDRLALAMAVAKFADAVELAPIAIVAAPLALAVSPMA